jgi:hypothetical protein
MDKNLKAEIFKANIIQLVNSAGIDICTTYYILKDVLGLVGQEYERLIKIAQEEQMNSQNEKEKEEQE